MRSASPEKVRAELWRRGVLSWKLKPHQRPIYDFFAEKDGRPHDMVRVGNIARQTGKTFTAIDYAVEQALQHARFRISYAAPEFKQLERFVYPNLETLLSDCPTDLAPEVVYSKGLVRFKNGSTILFYHVNQDGGKAARGPANHLFILDEAGFMDGLDGFLRSIVIPTFKTTKGRALVFSTPPETPGHAFASLVAEAKSQNRYLQLDIDQTDVTPEVRAELAKASGGENSSTFRREYKCQIIVDQEKAVIPEWAAHEAAIVVPVPPPDEYVKRLTALDWGFRDPAGLLFAYYDFRRAKLCIQRSLTLKGYATDQIGSTILENEKELWGDVKPYRRIADCDEQNQTDLNRSSKVLVSITSKSSLDSMVNAVRIATSQHTYEIDPSCSDLIFHLSSATWNDNRADWTRTEAGGHWDCLAALMYLLPASPRSLNPYPDVPVGVSHATHFIRPKRNGSSPLTALFPGLPQR